MADHAIEMREKLREALRTFYASRLGHPTWQDQEVRLLMADDGPFASFLADHEAALSTERARAEGEKTWLLALLEVAEYQCEQYREKIKAANARARRRRLRLVY